MARMFSIMKKYALFSLTLHTKNIIEVIEKCFAYKFANDKFCNASK